MEQLVDLLLVHGVLLVFAVTLLARAGAPLPAGPVLVVAGALGALGQISLLLTVLGSLLANLLGDLLWYLGGRRFGYRVMQWICKVSLTPDTCVRQSEGLFGRWGGWSLVAAKFVPGVSAVAPPMAGALGMPWRSFLAWDLGGAALWTAAYVLLGALFKTEVREVLVVLQDAGLKALLALVALVALAIAGRWVRRRRALGGPGIERISVVDLAAALAGERAPVLVDVRSALARRGSYLLPGAVAVELPEIASLQAQLAKEAELVVYCNCPHDVSALKAAAVLARMGFPRVRVLAGGFDAWHASMAPPTAEPDAQAKSNHSQRASV